MTDKELREIREKIACPQFGDRDYGAWGILNYEQRKTIRRLLEYVKSQNAYVDNFARALCEKRMLNGKKVEDFEDLQDYIKDRETEAVKRFIKKLKSKGFWF